MYLLWAQYEPRIVPGLGWTFPGQRMYHFWVYFGTFPVPEVEQKNRYPKMEQWCTETVPDLVQWLYQKGKDRLFLHLCTNMRPRLTQIWAETGTWNGSLLKEKGMALSFTVVNIVYRKVPIFWRLYLLRFACPWNVHRTFLRVPWNKESLSHLRCKRMKNAFEKRTEK